MAPNAHVERPGTASLNNGGGITFWLRQKIRFEDGLSLSFGGAPRS